jgi:hypothetical protein
MNDPEPQSQEPPGPGWWLASDGIWYPPEARPAPPLDTTPQAGSAPRTNKVLIFTYVALGLGFVASFMPWATVLVFTVDGTSGDGKVTLVLALLAGVFLLAWHIGESRSISWLGLCMLTTMGMAAVYWYDLINVSSRVGHANSSTSLIPIHAEVGSGLYLGVIASTAAVLLIWALTVSARNAEH